MFPGNRHGSFDTRGGQTGLSFSNAQQCSRLTATLSPAIRSTFLFLLFLTIALSTFFAKCLFFCSSCVCPIHLFSRLSEHRATTLSPSRQDLDILSSIRRPYPQMLNTIIEQKSEPQTIKPGRDHLVQAPQLINLYLKADTQFSYWKVSSFLWNSFCLCICFQLQIL